MTDTHTSGLEHTKLQVSQLALKVLPAVFLKAGWSGLPCTAMCMSVRGGREKREEKWQ